MGNICFFIGPKVRRQVRAGGYKRGGNRCDPGSKAGEFKYSNEQPTDCFAAADLKTGTGEGHKKRK